MPSGSALRRLAIPTIHKIRDLREKLSVGFRATIVEQLTLVGLSGGEVAMVDPTDLEITWEPELGADEEVEGVATPDGGN